MVLLWRDSEEPVPEGSFMVLCVWRTLFSSVRETEVKTKERVDKLRLRFPQTRWDRLPLAVTFHRRSAPPPSPGTTSVLTSGRWRRPWGLTTTPCPAGPSPREPGSPRSRQGSFCLLHKASFSRRRNKELLMSSEFCCRETTWRRSENRNEVCLHGRNI